MPSTLLLRSGIAEITRAAEQDLAALLTPTTSWVTAKTQLEALLPPLVDLYGSAAAAWAADWYDETRFEETISDRFRAVAAELANEASIDALAGEAVGSLVKNPDDFATTLKRAQGGLQRHVANGARDTITVSSVKDPKSRGWQRVGTGHNCKFCNMLIGRGAVYSTATAKFSAHDNCNCSAAPTWA